MNDPSKGWNALHHEIKEGLRAVIWGKHPPSLAEQILLEAWYERTLRPQICGAVEEIVRLEGEARRGLRSGTLFVYDSIEGNLGIWEFADAAQRVLACATLDREIQEDLLVVARGLARKLGKYPLQDEEEKG